MMPEETYGTPSAFVIEGTVLTRCLLTAGEAVIPEGVTEIGAAAFFARKNITRVIFPESLRKIGMRAFSYCISLEELCVPSGVVSVDAAAFSNCHALRRVTLPDTLSRLSDGVLESCTSLEELRLPSALTEIGNFALLGCRALTSVSIPAGVGSIGEAAFGDCSSLSELVIPEGIVRLESRTLAGCRSLASVTLPSSLRELGNAVFSACESLRVMELPDGVTSVGDHAFAYCISLRRVSFPQSVCLIGADCLIGLEPPVVVRMEEPRLFRMLSAESKILAVGGFLDRYDERLTDEEECRLYGEFIKKQKKTLARLLGHSLLFYRFLTDRALLSITDADALIRTESIDFELKTLLLEYKSRMMTPEMLLQMEREEERRLKRLLSGEKRTVAEWKRELRFSEMEDGTLLIQKYIGTASVAEVPARIGKRTVSAVGEGAFSGCAQVSAVILEEGVQILRDGAFRGCDELESVSVPESVTFIGDGAFDGCARLTVYTVAGSYASQRLREKHFSVEIKEE